MTGERGGWSFCVCTAIRGNERADEAARAALSSTVSTMKCPVTDLNPELTKHSLKVRQTEWDGCSSNELHSVKPHLGYCSVTRLGRRDAGTLEKASHWLSPLELNQLIQHWSYTCYS